jgi:hypothetical protein
MCARFGDIHVRANGPAAGSGDTPAADLSSPMRATQLLLPATHGNCASHCGYAAVHEQGRGARPVTKARQSSPCAVDQRRAVAVVSAAAAAWKSSPRCCHTVPAGVYSLALALRPPLCVGRALCSPARAADTPLEVFRRRRCLRAGRLGRVKIAQQCGLPEPRWPNTTNTNPHPRGPINGRPVTSATSRSPVQREEPDRRVLRGRWHPSVEAAATPALTGRIPATSRFDHSVGAGFRNTTSHRGSCSNTRRCTGW